MKSIRMQCRERIRRPSIDRPSEERRTINTNVQRATKHPISAWTKSILLGLGVLAISLAVVPPRVAQAATFVVNSTDDAVDVHPGDGKCEAAGGVCTLRAAIQEANVLSGGPHTITLPAGIYTLTIPGRAEDAAATGDLDITASLTIKGSGAATAIIDGGRLDRVFHVVAGSVTLSGVTIRGGDAGTEPRGGGGILNYGILTLNDSIVSGNSAAGGGGIFNGGTMTLNNSTVSGNDARGAGGIYNFFGTVTLSKSTVSGNTAGGVGGIRNDGGTMTLNDSTVSGNVATGNFTGGILNGCSNTAPRGATATLTNSTVSGNRAITYGGGIVNSNDTQCGATITLSNSTVTGNSAGGDGGGIAQDPRNTNSGTVSATVKLKNSIVADNIGSPNPNCSGTMTSLGHNLSSDATCLGGPGDLNRPTALLGPLANNGGPTQTQAPLAGSAAIDAVSLADCTDATGARIATDQRGVARPQLAACDIGSVEADVNPAHYQCYRVTGQMRPMMVKLKDQFATARQVRILQPVYLCAPVSKNDEAVEDQRTHLVCYQDTGVRPANKNVRVENQFGNQVLRVTDAQLLCVPSLKEVLK
jgi:CSLREA domain-containing protein